MEPKDRAGMPQGGVMLVKQGKSSLQDDTLMMFSITMSDQTSNQVKISRELRVTVGLDLRGG